MKSEMRTVPLSTGIRVNCFVHGHLEQKAAVGDTPLVLLHAWCESWRSFDRLIHPLSTHVLIAPDLRGHGQSDKPETGYALNDLAGDVAALLGALGVEKAHVLGSSSGGYLAQQLAVIHPSLVASMILVGAPLSLRGRPPFAEEVDSLRDPIPEKWVRDSLSWCRLLHTVPASYVDDRVQDALAIPAAIWKSSLRGFYEAIPPTELGIISVPTLILWGAHDHLVPRNHHEALVDRIQVARSKVYHETGHLVLWECPERVAEDVMSFLV